MSSDNNQDSLEQEDRDIGTPVAARSSSTAVSNVSSSDVVAQRIISSEENPSAGDQVDRSTMSAESAEVEAKLRAYFTETTALTNEEFERNKVVIKKEHRGAEGSKEYSRAYSLITEPLEHKFGASKHFISNSRDGEGDADNIKYRSIQEQFVGNYAKLEPAQQRCIHYDLMDVVMIPALKDSTATTPIERWSWDRTNLFEHWTTVDLRTVAMWQRDTNAMGGVNRQSSNWLLDFLMNS